VGDIAVLDFDALRAGSIFGNKKAVEVSHGIGFFGSMTTALIFHDDCHLHVTPPGHPEQVARLDAVLGALDGMDLLRVKAPLAAQDDLLRAHPQAHLDALHAAAPETGWRALDADTHHGAQGVLLRGPSGAGKSDLALRLIDAGAILVADDRVDVFIKGGVAFARAPANIAGLMESGCGRGAA